MLLGFVFLAIAAEPPPPTDEKKKSAPRVVPTTTTDVAPQEETHTFSSASPASPKRETATQTTVRVNSAGRPIDAHGRFISFAEARKLGWVDKRPLQPKRACATPAACSKMTWNEFQKATAGRGLSRTQV